MTDETRYKAKLYLRERPDGRVGVPTLRGILRIVRDGVSRELPLGSDVPYSTPLQALPKSDVNQPDTSPADAKASLLLQDAGQEIDLERCKGAVALMVIEETREETLLRNLPWKTTATLYWFDDGQCIEIVEYPSAEAAYNAAAIRSGSRDYEYRKQQRESRLIQVFWMTGGVIATGLLAFASVPPAVRVISWIALGIAAIVVLIMLGHFLWELWEGIAFRAPQAAAATYLVAAVLGLAGVIALIPPVFNILLVILLGIAIAKQVHVLWADPMPPWLVGGCIGAVVSFCLVGINPPLFRLIVWYHNHWQVESYQSCLSNSAENDTDPIGCVYEWASIHPHGEGLKYYDPRR